LVNTHPLALGAAKRIDIFTVVQLRNFQHRIKHASGTMSAMAAKTPATIPDIR